MNKFALLGSLLITSTVLSVPAMSSPIEEQREDNPQSCTTIVSSPEEQAAINKAQIKASEDIGAFLGACVPQMRHLMTWIKGQSSKSTQSLPIQSMIASSAQDPESVIENFKHSVQDTINQLVQNGLHLTTSYADELDTKKMGDLSAHSILASLLARIYEIELSLESAFPPYTPHTKELSHYYKLHKTFQKEKSSLEKLHQEQETYELPQEKSLSLKDPLAGLIYELEQKFQNAQNGLKRLTVILPTNAMPNFSSLEPEEATSPLVSPRNNISPSTILRSRSSSPYNGSIQHHTSTEDKKIDKMQASATSTEATDKSVKKKRAMSTVSSSSSSITSSAPSSPTVSSESRRFERSNSIGISPAALKESPKFNSRAEAMASPTPTERADSPKKTKSFFSFKSLKSDKKRSSSETSSSSSSPQTTLPSSSSPEK